MVSAYATGAAKKVAVMKKALSLLTNRGTSGLFLSIPNLPLMPFKFRIIE
jgi:hypothetical protein